MKFRCINNQDVETLITVGKVYAGHSGIFFVRIFRCDDKHEGHFKLDRFEPAEELVPVEPETFVYNYFMVTK